MAELGVSFEIYNKESVKRLQEENPDILPTYKISESKDLAYNKKQVNAAVTSAIIQGKSIDGIADDLQNKMESLNRNSAIKTARTAITNAQNAGSLSSMKELAAMGVDVQKEWVATLDDRTRPSHRAMDGERRDLDEAFSNGLMYPGASGSAKEVWNCRCTMVSYIPDIDTSDAKRWSRNPKTGKKEYVPDLTYSEWVEYKKTGKLTMSKTSHIKEGVYDDDFNGEVKYRYNEKTGELVIDGEEGYIIKYNSKNGTYQYFEGNQLIEQGKIDIDEYNGWIKKLGLKQASTKAASSNTKNSGGFDIDDLHPQKIAGVERTFEEMTFSQADSGKVNPGYITRKTEYEINCQTCVVAMEARIRGYNVVAKGRTTKTQDRLAQKTNLAWIDPSTGKNPKYITNNRAKTSKSYYDFLKKKISSGERYTLQFAWKSGGGHIVNIDLDSSGEVRIKDNQIPDKYLNEYIGESEIISYLNDVQIGGGKYSPNPQLLRIDNMKFNEKIVNQVLEKA